VGVYWSKAEEENHMEEEIQVTIEQVEEASSPYGDLAQRLNHLIDDEGDRIRREADQESAPRRSAGRSSPWQTAE